MKISSYWVVFFMLFSNLLSAQKKSITLEDIWKNNTFQQEHIDALRSLKNGKEYTVLNRDEQEVTVDAYSYETGEQTRTIINSSEIDSLDHFQSYEFNNDETAVLLSKDTESIYRRSKKAIYYVYDLEDKTLTKVSDDKINEPTFSPDGSKIAYAFENNLYIKDLDAKEVTQVTTDGKNNEIINGTTDWVYEEEFMFTRAYDWNKDGTKIGFLRFDESEVPTFTMELYGDSPKEHNYREPHTFKYPKAGEKNSEISLHLYDLENDALEQIDLEKNYEYLPRLKWTEDADVLSVQAMNRHQNNLDLIFVDASEHSAEVVFNETDENYIDVTDNLTFLEDNSFFWTSETDNWNHIYHYDKKGQLLNQITKGNWDVTSFYGFDKENKKLYFQSTENGSVNRSIYSIGLNGKNKKELSQEEGTNTADFSKNYRYYINTYNSLSTPHAFTVNNAENGDEIRVIKDNADLKDKLEDFAISDKEISTISVNGNELNMWMIKPPDFNPDKEYPLLLYQYSGPGSQEVSNSFFSANDYWYEMLAQNGYIVAAIDGRGTGFKGADFKKVTQLKLGKYEVEDQAAAAKKLGERAYIDQERIGIWGWSYGGFMSASALLRDPDVFKMAIAVAPVTSYRFYDTVYTERYMTTPQENPEGYDKYAPMHYVDNLEGNFLLVHGSGDDNVHVQNSMQLVEALIQADKDFEWMIYPDYDHGIFGGNARYHLFNKMTNFIKENL